MITKQSNNSSELNFETGESILFDKPLNRTSFQIVYELRKIIKVKKVGHAGTLDPKATGLLIICTGKKTKEITKFQDLQKTYTGTFTIGKTTPSMDSETGFENELPFEHYKEDEILSVRNSFLGEIEQIPPMYSAVNYGGEKLYKLARKGKTVHRESRKITVYQFEITKIDLPEIHFRIDCSKGTYIRVIAHDFGQKLGCGAYLSSLRRTKIGDYSVENAFSINEFREFYSGINHTSTKTEVSF